MNENGMVQETQVTQEVSQENNKTAEERNNIVNKRITFSKNTYKKINIIKMLESDAIQNMTEADAIGYIIDKAVDFYYRSDVIQKQLTDL